MKFVYTVMAILLLFWLYNIIKLIRLLYQCPKLASLLSLLAKGCWMVFWAVYRVCRYKSLWGTNGWYLRLGGA